MVPNEIIEKIQKLLKLSESSNQHEAALAAARATEMMLKYQLDEAAVTAKVEADEPVNTHELGRAGKKNREVWKGTLASGISRAFGCKIWWSGVIIKFVGRKSDLEAVLYFYEYLTKEVDRLTEKCWEDEGEFSGESAKSWKTAFRVGAAHEIGSRMQEQRKVTFHAAEQAASTALVVLQNRAVAVDKYYEQEKKVHHLRSTNGPTIRSRDGYQAGRDAGKSVNLGGSGSSLTGAKKQLGK